MRDLLQATSRKRKYDDIPQFVSTTYQWQSFIRDDDYRAESFMSASDDSCSSDSSEVTIVNEDDETSTTRFPSSHEYSSTIDIHTPEKEPILPPSYISYDDQSMYHDLTSSPTYIPGDYHDISLPDPTSTATETDHVSTINHNSVSDSSLKLPFSIDALLGDITSDANHFFRSNSDTAQIISHVPLSYSGQMQYSQLQSQPYCHQELLSHAMSSRSTAVSAAIYWCHVCARFCSSSSSADSHRLIHTREGVKCDLLTATFKQHGYVTKHENTGFLGRIKCGLCGKTVCSQYFVKHVRVHNSHTCKICFMEFTTNSRLRDHLNIHSGEMPYACAECPRTFSSRIGRTQHMRNHRNFQKFRCSFCDKALSSRHGLTVHERIHSGNNPYVCEVVNCRISFPQKVQLDIHMRNTHL